MTDSVLLADVRGHERPIGILRRTVASDRVHHAYLFAGPRGVGKRRVALGLAALVNCSDPVGLGAALDACGRCVSCVKTRSGNHPDIVQVSPDGRFIKIDQVREVQSRSRFRPHEAPRRVVVIDDADALREEAANALLKSLEEPRGDTMFILVTASPQRLLTTIRSRCQPLHFGRLSDADVRAVLADLGRRSDDADAAARLSEGSVGRALHLLESEVYAERVELCARIAALPTMTSGAIVKQAETLSRTPANIPDLLALARALVRDAALVAAGADRSRVLNADRIDDVDALAAALARPQLSQAIDRIGEAELMLLGNVNPKMVVETLLLALARPTQRPLSRRLS